MRISTVSKGLFATVAIAALILGGVAYHILAAGEVAAGIGAKFLGTTGGNFTGAIDDFRVYSRGLQDYEVNDQWQHGT